MSGRVWSPLLDLQVCELCHFCKEFRVSRYCGLQKLLDLILVVVLAFIFIFWLWVILMMVGEAKQGKDQGWASPWMWKSSENMLTKWWILLQIIIVTLRAFLCAAKWRWDFFFFLNIFFCSPLSLFPILFCAILEFSLQITIVFKTFAFFWKLLSFLVCWFHKIAHQHLTDLNGYVKGFITNLAAVCPFSHENSGGCWYSLVIWGRCCQIVHQQSRRQLRMSLLVKLQDDPANPFEMELF